MNSNFLKKLSEYWLKIVFFIDNEFDETITNVFNKCSFLIKFNNLIKILRDKS
jgi:hypothetical protein